MVNTTRLALFLFTNGSKPHAADSCNFKTRPNDASRENQGRWTVVDDFADILVVIYFCDRSFSKWTVHKQPQGSHLSKIHSWVHLNVKFRINMFIRVFLKDFESISWYFSTSLRHFQLPSFFQFLLHFKLSRTIALNNFSLGFWFEVFCKAELSFGLFWIIFWISDKHKQHLLIRANLNTSQW